MVINQDEDVESLSIKKDNQKSDVFGLWVKLKIPKEEGREEDKHKEEEGVDFGDQEFGFKNKDEMNNTKRVCHVCQKVFSSGKALGGHMRIHVQLANKKDLVFNNKLKLHQTIKFKKQYSREGSEEKAIDSARKKHHYCGSGKMIEKPTCPICGKGFPSIKSLFGHMRCHPDRGWRGIHPPSSMVKNSSSSSLSDDDQVELPAAAAGEKKRAVDLTESLMGWPVTAKRGRKATAVGSSSELSSSEDDQLRDAVNYLMMLAEGDSPGSSGGVMPRQSFGESEAANSCSHESKIIGINQFSKSKRRMIDQSPVGIRNELKCPNEVGKALTAGSSDVVHGESVSKLEDDHEHNHYDDQMVFESSSLNALMKNRKRRKKMKLCDLKLSKNASPADHKVVEATPPRDKYRCNTCDKSFPTHQALGGHRSSHNKFNIILHNSMGETKQDNNRGVISFNKNFFSTSQALEGRKRSNDSGLVEAQSSQAPSSSEQTSHMCGKVLDFDLNEVPPSEDEAGFESELACSW